MTVVHVLTVIEGKSEEITGLIELTNFKLAEYQLQFDVDPIKDPEMLERYSVGPDDVEFLEKNIKKALQFDFKRYAYFIEAAEKE